MRDLYRQLLDKRIGRRTFVKRLIQAGVSVATANLLLGRLGFAAEPAKLEPGRIVTDVTGGDVMLEFMQDWRSEYLFGLAGSEEVGLLDALVDRDVPFVTGLHESAVMAMADGYSRSTGKTPVVSLHSVAGSAYALGQLVGSFRDRVPVVVCAGRQASDYRGQDGFLEAANLHTLPQDYARWTWDVIRPETIPEVLRRAFMLAEAPPGGPTFVTFSHDLWEVNVPKTEILPRSRSLVETDIAPSDEHVKQVAQRLLAAQLPVLYLGNEGIRYNPSDLLAEIAESVGALVMLPSKTPIMFPNTHPNFAGRFPGDATELSAKIDCFWSLGGHMFKVPRKARQPLVSRKAVVMHTSLAEVDVGRNYPIDTAAIASIRTTSKAALQELKKHDLNSSAIRARKRFVEEYKRKRKKLLADRLKTEWNNKPIATIRLLAELDKIMNSTAYVVSEVITAKPYIDKYLNFDHTVPMAKRRLNFDTTSGVLGWGVAAALGVKIGNPKKEVWCLTGDGCFNFGSQALWSAARYEIPVGIVIFNNGEYQANRKNQVRYGGKRMRETGRFIGVNLKYPDIDYTAMASSFGIAGERVTVAKKLAGALQRCQRSMHDGEPYVVDVKIAKEFEGKDSDWYDFFSVARMQNG